MNQAESASNRAQSAHREAEAMTGTLERGQGFAAAGYGVREIGFGARPAVLVVDFQRAFTDPAFPMGRSAHLAAAVENTVRLLEGARDLAVPVATCVVGWESERDMGHWKVESLYRDLFPGGPARELDERIAPFSDFNFVKGAPSMFFGTPLLTFLTKQCIDTVVVTGCTTSGCIRATVVDAFSHGYRVIVPESCVGDQELGAHESNLADVGRRYADVLGLEDTLKGLEKAVARA